MSATLPAVSRAARFHLSRPLRRCRGTGLLLPKSLLVRLDVAVDSQGTPFLRPRLLDLSRGAFDVGAPDSLSTNSNGSSVFYIIANRLALDTFMDRQKITNRNEKNALRKLEKEYGTEKHLLLRVKKNPTLLKKQMHNVARSSIKNDSMSADGYLVHISAEHPKLVDFIERSLLVEVHEWISRYSAIKMNASISDLVDAAELDGVEALLERRSEYFYSSGALIVNDGESMNEMEVEGPKSHTWNDLSAVEYVETCALLALQRFFLFHESKLRFEF